MSAVFLVFTDAGRTAPVVVWDRDRAHELARWWEGGVVALPLAADYRPATPGGRISDGA